MRSQFTHCIDVGPTILEAAGIPEPKAVDGIEQEPMDGTSFLYTLDDAKAPERHTTQYFEMFAGRAMYKDGWWALASVTASRGTSLRRRSPSSGRTRTGIPDRDVGWELYDLTQDFSQAHDVASEHPDKLAELQELWWQEAERNRVLPLMGGMSVFYGILPPLPTVARFEFAGDVQNVQRGMVPRIQGRSYAIEAELNVPEGGAEGVIVADADFIGGFALWVGEDGLLDHTYQFLGVETYKQVATEKLPDRRRQRQDALRVRRAQAGHRRQGDAVHRRQAGGRGPHATKTVPITFTSYSGMDIGRDNGGVVDLDYEHKAPYAFTGTVKKVTFDLRRTHTKTSKALHQHHRRRHRSRRSRQQRRVIAEAPSGPRSRAHGSRRGRAQPLPCRRAPSYAEREPGAMRRARHDAEREAGHG